MMYVLLQPFSSTYDYEQYNQLPFFAVQPSNQFYSSTPSGFLGFQVAEAGFSPRAIFF
jgi:hypothetical protein